MNCANYELIVLAREANGITQLQLANILNIEQSTVSKVENGLLEFPKELVRKLSDALGFPENFFYQDWKPIRVEGHYRRKMSLPVKVLKECKAVMTLAERHLSLMLDAVQMPAVNYPKWDVETDGCPTMCARYVREYWKVPRGRIENLTELIEDNGIAIIEMDFTEMDGFSTFSKDNLPLMFINKNMPGDRDLFNKAHEKAHFIMHFGQKISEGRDIDREANEFASEFLMPTNDIESSLTKLSIEKLVDLKRYWRVSMASIIMKAKSCNLLTQNQYEYLWKQMSALGYRKKEPITTEREKATLFNELLGTYLNDFNYSKRELAALFKLEERKLDQFYFNNSNKLKIIRRAS